MIIRTGDIVKLRYSGALISNRSITTYDKIWKKPCIVLFYKVPFLTNEDPEIREGFYPCYSMFIQGGRIIAFTAHKEEDYIVSKHGNIFNNDNYLTFDEHQDSTTQDLPENN